MATIGEKSFNISYDLKNLFVFDSNSFGKEEITEEDITLTARLNINKMYSELYNMQKSQIGKDEENRDFEAGPDNVNLPESTSVLPRSKRIPKAKALTKWEKFRIDKGMAPREKRSRMIYSDLAQDFVPRWGHKRY